MTSYGGAYTGPAYGGPDDLVFSGPTVLTPVRPPRTVVLLRDPSGARVGEVDDYLQLQYVSRHQDIGSWVLDLDAASPALDVLREPRSGIEVVRNGTLVFSGPRTKLRRARSSGNDTVTVSGADDSVWLARRLAHPQPGSSAPSGGVYGTTAFDARTGQASTILRQYANVNAGPGAVVARRVAGLTLGVDPLVGSTVTGEGRWQVLLELMQGLAVAGGDLGFGIVSDGTGGLLFDVYQPTDRSASAVFSAEMGNLGDFDYSLDAPTGNYVVGGGGGELTARTIVESSDSTSITTWGRVEFFRDRRDTTNTTEISQTLSEELAAQAEKRAATINPVDTPLLTYGVHYFLGDQVTAVIDGVSFAEVVREVKVTVAGNGETVQPTLATPGAGPASLPDLFAAAKRLTTRVANLERR